MTFSIIAERNGRAVKVDFPCTDSVLWEKLQSIGYTDPFDTMAVIKTVEWSELSSFSGKRCDLDELNFLAKYSESFDRGEHSQFCAAITTRQTDSLRDAINIAFNLRNFTLIDSFGDLEAVGRRHYLTMNLAMSLDEADSIDFAALGRSLPDSGRGQITPYGVLFENGLTEQLVYCGRSFPGYIYKECPLVMDIAYMGERETICLPCEELAIDKALHRMGAPSPDVCDCVDLIYSRVVTQGVAEICPAFSVGDIYELNHLAEVCKNFTAEDYDKLVAVCKLTGADDLTKAKVLSENLDAYRLTPDVATPEEYGRHTIENEAGGWIDANRFGRFFDYQAYGESLIAEHSGSFCDSGYIETDDEALLTPFDQGEDITL